MRNSTIFYLLLNLARQLDLEVISQIEIFPFYKAHSLMGTTKGQYQPTTNNYFLTGLMEQIYIVFLIHVLE